MLDSHETFLVLKGMFLGAVVVLALIALIRDLRKSAAEKKAAEEEAGRKRSQEVATRHKLDQQNNIGRRIFNALTRYIEEYPDVGLVVSKIEDNGGHFSVVVDRKDNGSMQGKIPIVQISIDYVHQEDYPFHVHTGSYGADWWTKGEDAFVRQVLGFAVDQIVVEVERLNKSAV